MKTGICKHTRFVLGVLLSATTITACSNFLDTEQLGVTTQEAFYKTDQDATEALYAIYNKWQSNSLSFFQFRNLLSDDVIGGGGSRGDNSQGEEIDEFRFGPSNTMLTGCFEQYYEIIYAANVLIANVNPDTEIKTQAVAEAKALRALAYIDLVSLWGPVPLVTKPLQPSEYAQPNGEVSAIWSQIETDLNEAISVLPLKSQLSAAKKGNVSKGTAQAWLGKAYLYQEKYDEAAAMFDNVINSGEYDLENSYVIGDRPTDMELAYNLGAKGIWLHEPDEALLAQMPQRPVLVTTDWDRISEFLFAGERVAEIHRITKETDVYVQLNLDGTGNTHISTGLGFFDHMLEQIGKHAGIDLTIQVKGDLEVDEHHTIEDTALTLGEALLKALGDKRGIERYGYTLPMDDCLCSVVLDFGGRPWLVWNAEFNRERIGDVPTEMFLHFFKSLSDSARMNLNIKAEGQNEHHKIEGIFKALARSLKMAIHRDIYHYNLPSTKGLI